MEGKFMLFCLVVLICAGSSRIDSNNNLNIDLKSAIEYKVSGKIEILQTNETDTNNFVIYKDESSNIIGNTYFKDQYGMFKYSSDNEQSFQFDINKKNNDTFRWAIYPLNDYNQIIWGVVFEPNDSKEISFEFVNELNENSSFRVPIINNSFCISLNNSFNIKNVTSIKVFNSTGENIATFK